MCAIEVQLFDVGRDALVTVEQGCVIWVRAEISAADAEIPWETLPVAAARPLVVFELLQRVLEYEGLSGRFVIEPAAGGCTRLKAFGELEPREERRLYDDPGGRRFSAQGRRTDRRIEMVLPTHTPRAVDATVGETIAEHGRPALHMHLLATHYSHPLGDLRSGLREACARVERVREVAAMLDANSPAPPDMDERMRAFRIALARDLDTPTALRVLFEWLREAELRPDRIGDSHLHEMLALLSLDELLEDLDEPPGDLPEPPRAS